jgi:hypothetical protein
VRGALVLLLLTGCRQVFGLDSPEHVDAAPDGFSPRVTGTLELHVLQNNAAGLPEVVNTRHDPNSVTLTVTQNGVTSPVDLLPDGSFSFDRTAARYTLLLDSFSQAGYQLTADHVILVDRVSGRIDALTPSANTLLSMSIPGRPSGATEYIASSGVFSNTAITGATTTMSWSSAGFFGAPGLLDAAHFDHLYYLGYMLSGNTLSLSHFAQANVTLADGATTLVTLNVAAAAATFCAKVKEQFAAEYARVQPLVRPGYTSSTQVSLVRALASAEMSTGWTLVSQSFSSPADIEQAIAFANPIPGTTPQLLWTTVFYRSIAGANVADSASVYLPLDTSTCSAITTAPVGAVAMPHSVTLNGIDLQDGIVVGVDKTADFAWSTSNERADLYSVTIFSIKNGALAVVASYFTTDARLSVDPTLFEPNVTYSLNVSVRTGFPNASMGDFSTNESTRGLGFMYSPTFTIVRAAP